MQSQELDSFFFFSWYAQDTSMTGYINDDLFERNNANHWSEVVTSNSIFVYRNENKFGVEDIFENKLSDAIYKSINIEDECSNYCNFYLASKENKNGYSDTKSYHLYSSERKNAITDTEFSEHFSDDDLLYLYDSLDNEYFLVEKNNNYANLIDSIRNDIWRDDSKDFKLLENTDELVLFTFVKNTEAKKQKDALDSLFIEQISEKLLSNEDSILTGVNLSNIEELSSEEKKQLLLTSVFRKALSDEIKSRKKFLRINNNRNSVEFVDYNSKNIDTDYLIIDEINSESNTNAFICVNSNKETSVISENGEVLIPFTSNKINFLCYTKNGFLLKVLKSGGNYEILNEKGNSLTNDLYRSVKAQKFNGKTLIQFYNINKEYGLLNTSGDRIEIADTHATIINNMFLHTYSRGNKGGKLYCGDLKLIDLKDGTLKVREGSSNKYITVQIDVNDLKTSFNIDSSQFFYLPDTLKKILVQKGIKVEKL